MNKRLRLPIHLSMIISSISDVDHDRIRVDIDGLQADYMVNRKGTTNFIHNASIGNITLKEKDRFPIKEKEKVQGGYESPIPSQVVKIHINQGDKIKEGDPLLVISSMNVEAGFLLLKIKDN